MGEVKEEEVEEVEGFNMVQLVVGGFSDVFGASDDDDQVGR